jgi:hypothetical protein
MAFAERDECLVNITLTTFIYSSCKNMSCVLSGEERSDIMEGKHIIQAVNFNNGEALDLQTLSTRLQAETLEKSELGKILGGDLWYCYKDGVPSYSDRWEEGYTCTCNGPHGCSCEDECCEGECGCDDYCGSDCPECSGEAYSCVVM